MREAERSRGAHHREFRERLLQQPLLIGCPRRHARVAAGRFLLPLSSCLSYHRLCGSLLGDLLCADLLPDECLVFLRSNDSGLGFS